MKLQPWLRGLVFIGFVFGVILVVEQWNSNWVNIGVTLDGTQIGGFTREQVEALVQELAIEREKPPQNASFDWETGAVMPEQPGQAVDVEATVRAALTASVGEEVKLVMREISAQVTQESLRAEVKSLHMKVLD